jgi:hypothetical protein
MTGSAVAFPSMSNRLLGAVGILGGAVLLAAYVVGIPAGLNDVRLILYTLGAIAVVFAIHRRQVVVAPRLSLAVTAAAIIANAWCLSMIVLARGQELRFGGEFWLAFDLGFLAMWLTDAIFGFVALRIGVVTRWGALALGIGSLLAILGMDRLGLSSATDITIFGRLGLTGVALNGIGWILLGLDVVLGGSLALRLRSALAR